MKGAMPRLELVEEIFHEALQLPGGSGREAWLAARCGSDAALCAEVASLLLHYDLANAPAGSPRAARGDEAPVPDDRFGVYRPLRLLGRGGMSAVYLAERTDGRFEKRVAIKVMAAYLAGDEFLHRFTNEGRFLSALHHPHICELLDGGISSSGYPYLAIEYIEGEPLDRYCDSRHLDVRARLRLFLKVCAAVEYAHRQLILHRDLKPANILVTEDATPKLLDFGTAALLAETPGVTVTRARMLTPRYASPEQLRGERPGVSSDVFSLGVVLYELLTGAWPFGDSVSVVNELRRATEDMAATAPGSVITGESAALRSLSAERLRRLLTGDLSAILRKALASDPSQRYPTVEAFAADLSRFLEGRPVKARTSTALYRSRKFLRRHWLPVSAAAVFVAGLTLATGFAIRQARAAEGEARKAEALNQFLTSVLVSPDSLTFDPQNYTVAQMLETAEKRLVNAPADVASAMQHRSLAVSFVAMSRYDKAEFHLARAIPVLERAGDEGDLALALCTQGSCYMSEGKYQVARSAYDRALAILAHLGRRADPNTVFQAKIGIASLNIFFTHVQTERGRLLLREAIELGRANPAIERTDLALALSYAADALIQDSRWKEAESMAREALKVGRAEDPEGAWQFGPLYRLQSLRERQNDPAGAKTIAAQMIDVTSRNFGGNNVIVARAKMLWAVDAAETGEKPAAVQSVMDAMPLVEEADGRCSADRWRMALSAARVMQSAGRLGDAEHYARESVDATCTWDSREVRVAQSWEALGEILKARKNPRQAIDALEHADSIYEAAGSAWSGAHQHLQAEMEDLRRRP